MTGRPYLSEGYHPIAPGKLANVVTYLEVTAPPVAPRRPVPDGYVLEAVNHWDLDVFRSLYVEIGHEWLWSSRLLMSDEALRARLDRSDSLSFAPVRDGRRMGILEMDFADPANVEISFFGLVPAAIGGGIGGWLMQEALDMAYARPETRRVWLHTCHFDSPQALPFYMRMGFSPYARAVEVHDDPRFVGRIDESAGPHIPFIRDARRPDGL